MSGKKKRNLKRNPDRSRKQKHRRIKNCQDVLRKFLSDLKSQKLAIQYQFYYNDILKAHNGSLPEIGKTAPNIIIHSSEFVVFDFKSKQNRCQFRSVVRLRKAIIDFLLREFAGDPEMADNEIPK